MSEQTGEPAMLSAAQFHEAPGVDDWRVTATGLQAVFSATSLAHAARLMDTIVQASEQLGGRPDVDRDSFRPSASTSRSTPRPTCVTS